MTCFKDNTTKTAEKSTKQERHFNFSTAESTKLNEQPMESISSNGFGSETYWNRPTSRGRSKRSSRSLSPAPRDSNNTAPAPSALELHRPIGRLTADISNRAPASSNAKDSNAEQFASNTRLQRSANVSKTQAST